MKEEFKENSIVRLNDNCYEDEKHRGKYFTVIKEVGDDLIKCQWKDETEYFYRIDLEIIKKIKMKKERFIEILKNREHKPPFTNNCFEGLQIIAKYTDDPISGSDENIIYSEHIDNIIKNGITESDVVALANLNWLVDEGEYLACFV